MRSQPWRRGPRLWWFVMSTFGVGIILASCGQQAASEGVSISTDTSLPVDATPAQTQREILSSESDQIPCDIGGQLPATHVAVVAKSINWGEPFSNDNGFTAQSIMVDYDPATVVQFREFDPTVAPDVVTDLTRLLVNPSQFLDDAIIDELITGQNPTLFVHYAELGAGQVRPRLMVAATTASDGEVKLLGRCGRQWQPAIKAGAHSMGRAADISFMRDFAAWGTLESEAVGNAFGNIRDPALIWEQTTPEQRSLDIRDVPRSRLGDFYLTGTFIELSGDVSPGFVSLRTSQGIVSTFEIGNMSGVVPMLIPLKESVGSFYFVPAGSDLGARGELIGEVDLRSFDEFAGTMITIQAGPTLVVSASPLAPGELERRMGLSREDIERLCESMLR